MEQVDKEMQIKHALYYLQTYRNYLDKSVVKYLKSKLPEKRDKSLIILCGEQTFAMKCVAAYLWIYMNELSKYDWVNQDIEHLADRWYSEEDWMTKDVATQFVVLFYSRYGYVKVGNPNGRGSAKAAGNEFQLNALSAYLNDRIRYNKSTLVAMDYADEANCKNVISVAKESGVPILKLNATDVIISDKKTRRIVD